MHQASAATEPTDTAEGLLREWSVLVRTIERAPGKTVRVGEVTLAHLHKSTALGDAWAELDGECGSDSSRKRTVVLVRLNEGVVQVINRGRAHVQEIKSAANPKDLLKRIVAAITDTHAGTHGSGVAEAAAEPSIDPDSVRTDMYFYLAENAQQVKLRYGALHGAGHEIYYDTCFARSSTVLVLRYQHITAEHIHGDLDVNVSTHGHVFVLSSGRDRVQVRIQGDMESLAGAVVRAGAQLLLHKLKTGWSSETAEAAAEPPAPSTREVFCQRLKAKYDLDLDPSKITYMGRDGLDYDGSVGWSGRNLTRIPVRFRKVTGYFNCYHNHLTTLAGAPGRVGGDFYCNSNHLTSLEHAPAHVGGDFLCAFNHLTSLEHAPAHVGGDFSCASNRLTSLEHAPKHVGRDFYCYNNHLPRDTKPPKGVKGEFVLGQQTPAPVHGAAEPASDARTHISPGEMKGLVKNLTFHKSFQLAGYTVTLTPDHTDAAFKVIFERDKKKMCFLVLRYFTGHVRVSNISAADAHIRRRVELAHVPLEVTAFLRMVLRACLDLAAVAFDKYAREHG